MVARVITSVAQEKRRAVAVERRPDNDRIGDCNKSTVAAVKPRVAAPGARGCVGAVAEVDGIQFWSVGARYGERAGERVAVELIHSHDLRTGEQSVEKSHIGKHSLP